MNGVEAGKPKLIEATRILIGEGVEEVLFFKALLGHLGIHGVQVEHYNGKAGLGSYLKTLTTRPGFAAVERLGITRDADANPTGAVTSVQDSIGRAQFPSALVVRTFVLPGNGRDGALENLCLQTIEGQPLGACIEDYFTCVARTTSRSFASESNVVLGRALAGK